MTPPLLFRTLLLFYLLIFAVDQVEAREAWYRNLDLEKILNDAKLVMVARVTVVGETRFVSGGKGHFSVKQYTFKPIETLKGFYSRDELLLTNNDLQSHYYHDNPLRISEGEYRLLILGRSQEGYALRHYTTNAKHAIPPLSGERDPLIAAVRVLLQINQAPRRTDKVKLAVAGLKEKAAHGAIPLFQSLKRRRLIAAQWRATMAAVTPYLSDASPVVREEAAMMIKEFLKADYLELPSLHEAAVASLADSLSGSDAHIASRAAMFEALGEAGAAVHGNNSSGIDLLRLGGSGEALALQSARLRALAELDTPAYQEAVQIYYDELPLDTPEYLQQAAGAALIRLTGAQAPARIETRISTKYKAGLNLRSDIELLQKLPTVAAVPLLLEVGRLGLDLDEQLALARVCEEHSDPRLVGVLAGMLDPQLEELRGSVIDALMGIDTKEAALLLKPELFAEKDLAKKLVIAEFLGRHGYQDGFPFAIEHMSEARLSQQAVIALIAIRHTQSKYELRRIWETSNDPVWQRPAIEALGGLQASEFTQRFLGIAQDFSHPLAPAAIIALGHLRARKALPIVDKGLTSGYRHVVLASARAASRLLSLPGVTGDRIRDQLVSLFGDKRKSLAVRMAAFKSLQALGDSRVSRISISVVDEAALERTQLLKEIEDFLTKHQVPLELQ